MISRLASYHNEPLVSHAVVQKYILDFSYAISQQLGFFVTCVTISSPVPSSGPFSLSHGRHDCHVLGFHGCARAGFLLTVGYTLEEVGLWELVDEFNCIICCIGYAICEQDGRNRFSLVKRVCAIYHCQVG